MGNKRAALIFRFLEKYWAKEGVPADRVDDRRCNCHDLDTWIFKKENPEDCANYMCFDIPNHDYTYKIMSAILLATTANEGVRVCFSY